AILTPPTPAFAQVEQDSFASIYTLRYGLINDLQLFTSIPLFYQTNTVDIGGSGNGISGQRRSRTRTEWGNVSVGLRYALIKEGVGYPDVIPTIVGQIPTGRNSGSIGGGVALVKSLDPAVLFANFNYRHAFIDDSSVDLSRLLPEAEDTFDVTFGYAFALNDTLTLNTAVAGFFTQRTKFDSTLASGQEVRGILSSQERLSLQLGLTSLLTENLYIEPSVSFGLTGTGSNAAFGVNIPYTFGF
ncbi:MAG: transporter, partial [Candidatus Binatia bacterium]